MTDKINVGLIGYGFAGQVFHAPLIHALPSMNLYAVVERHEKRAVRDFPGLKMFGESNQLLNDQNVDLVVVATPNASHFDLARAALLAGKHVVVDKPFTLTSTQAQSLIELAQEQKRLLSVYQNRRWDGDFRTIQEVLKNGVCGDILEYEAHYDKLRNLANPEAWRESGEPGSGILYDLGSHLIDQALVLFGLPDTVTADLRVRREGARAIDDFEIIMAYPKLKVTLKSSMLKRESGPRFMLHGKNGSFVKFGFDPQEDALKSGQRPYSIPEWGVEDQAQWGRLNTETNGLHFMGFVETLPGCYQAFYENVFDAIVNGKELRVKPKEAWQTIKIIELALLSNSEQRTVTVSG